MKSTVTLVIACGNALRGDDAVGLVAAERVMGWQLPGVRVVFSHQLVPELTEEMKWADRVLFIDANADRACGTFHFRPLGPRKSRRLLGHHESPENLLALLQDMEGRAPRAWLLSIRASSFEHGEGFTGDTAGCLDQAMPWIHEFLAEQPCTKSA